MQLQMANGYATVGNQQCGEQPFDTGGTVVSVIPWGDVVPALDEQEGMVQRIVSQSGIV